MDGEAATTETAQTLGRTENTHQKQDARVKPKPQLQISEIKTAEASNEEMRSFLPQIQSAEGLTPNQKQPSKHALKKKNGNVIRPMGTLTMIPKLGNLSLVGRKLFNTLIYSTQMQVWCNMAVGRPLLATDTFTSPLDELAKLLEVDNTDVFCRNVKQTLEEIRACQMDMLSPSDSLEKITFHNMSLLSTAKIYSINRRAHISWAFPPEILAAIIEPDYYTTLKLSIIGKLKTYRGIAMYEICSRFKNNPSGATSWQTVDWWMDALQASKDENIQKRDWRKFKYKYLNPKNPDLLEEINTNTDLDISLEEDGARPVKLVRFRVSVKASALAEVKKYITPEFAASAIEIKVAEGLIDTLLSSGKNPDAIRHTFDVIRLRLSDTKADPIINMNSYFRSVLKDTENKYEWAKNGGTGTYDEISAIKSGVSPDQSAGDASKIAPPSIRTMLKTEFDSLSPEIQDKFRIEAIDELKESGLYLPTIRKALESGGIPKTGIFASKSVEIYARTTYGKDWERTYPSTKA